MVVVFTTSHAITAYHHLTCEFESLSWWGVFDWTFCDKVCQWLAAGQWFTPVSFTDKTDHHDRQTDRCNSVYAQLISSRDAKKAPCLNHKISNLYCNNTSPSPLPPK